MKTADRERLLRKREMQRNGEKPVGVEVVGVNVAPEPKKWKLKRSSSSKGLQIVWEDDEK